MAVLVLAKLTKAREFTGSERVNEQQEGSKFDEPGMLKSTLFQLR